MAVRAVSENSEVVYNAHDHGNVTRRSKKSFASRKIARKWRSDPVFWPASRKCRMRRNYLLWNDFSRSSFSSLTGMYYNRWCPIFCNKVTDTTAMLANAIVSSPVKKA